MQHARNLLNQHPVVVLGRHTVGEAAELLRALDQRFLPVIDEDHRLVGTLTDRELSTLFGTGTLPRPCDVLQTPVARVMNREHLVLDPDADLPEIVDFMVDHAMTVVPIVDERHRLLGTVMYADVLRALST